MNAKDELLERLKFLNFAVSSEALIDVGIAPSEHNGAANLLRKGLGIIAFNILEDYIKNRTIESLSHLSNSGIAFTNLPDQLQEAATLGALSALISRSRLLKQDNDDWKSFIQNEALKIYSTQKLPFEISDFSLLSVNSNIRPDDISQVLNAFGIKGGWNILKNVSDSIGGGLPDLCETYKNAASRRNSAAHTAKFPYEYQWLIDIRNEIIAIVSSFDILLTARCRQVTSNPTKSINEHNITSALNFRFLIESGNKYKEQTVISGGKTRKLWNNIEDAKVRLLPQLEIKQEFLVIINSSKRIENWFT